MGAAVFLYGFTLLYGGTGTTDLAQITEAFSTGSINTIAMAGLMLSLIGVAFKIAAVPMHFYTPDVYEGAAAPVSAFLAFVPKTAGFVAIILLLSTVGWTHGPAENALPESIRLLLWIMAALTMTVGNVLAVLQNKVKRILAYSSIAHSGYMLVGVIAGPGDTFTTNGLAAVLFYLLCYGVMNLGAFAVLACVERRRTDDGDGIEIETVDDLRGLCTTFPLLGWVMVICSMSLLGLPPLLGFFGKVPLFTSAISAGEIPLVLILGVNSAIAAWYYLRLARTPLLEKPGEDGYTFTRTTFLSRPLAATLSAVGVIVLAVMGNGFMDAAQHAATTTVVAPDRLEQSIITTAPPPSQSPEHPEADDLGVSIYPDGDG
jgi:NADH-quinone oxidoreductase subunit N